MKRIIAGRRYDTDTATEICDVSPRGFYRGDHRWEDTRLYRTKSGNWFLAGEGGPTSRWGRALGQNSYSEGEGISPLSAEEACSLLERYGDPDEVEAYFKVVDA